MGKCWGRGGDFFQWMSLLAPGYAQTKECIFLIFAISTILRTNMSMQVAYKIIIWSLKVLWIGKWPSHGPFGENLHDLKAHR